MRSAFARMYGLSRQELRFNVGVRMRVCVRACACACACGHLISYYMDYWLAHIG